MHAACIRVNAVYRLHSPVRSKCGHLHLITQCKSRGRRPASWRQRPAIRGRHAACMQPACSPHYAEKYALRQWSAIEVSIDIQYTYSKIKCRNAVGGEISLRAGRQRSTVNRRHSKYGRMQTAFACMHAACSLHYSVVWPRLDTVASRTRYIN